VNKELWFIKALVYKGLWFIKGFGL